MSAVRAIRPTDSQCILADINLITAMKIIKCWMMVLLRVLNLVILKTEPVGESKNSLLIISY